MTFVSWADLTSDALFSISECLESHSDSLRFRAVCNSWRKSLPPPQKCPQLPKLMHFPSDDPVHHRVMLSYVLYQTTLYRLEDPQSSPNNGWLVMVSEPNEQGKFCLVNPFTMRPVENLPDEYFPKVLNSVNFRVTEVCKRFNLQWIGNNDENAEQPFENDDNIDDELEHKAEVPLDFDSSNSFFVVNEARLCSVTIGDEVWTMVNREIVYHDIVRHNGSLYSVDRFGVVAAVKESSYDSLTIPVSEPFMGDWYLLKSGGDLFLVGREYTLCDDQVYYDNDTDSFIKRPGVEGNVLVDFKVYVLDDTENNGDDQEWTELEDLGDKVFVVSRSWSFAIDASNFAGCKGNRIIYVDEVKDPYVDSEDDVYDEDDEDGDGDVDDELGGIILEDINVGVYNVRDCSTAPLTSWPAFYQIFWPPPAWLRSTNPVRPPSSS